MRLPGFVVWAVQIGELTMYYWFPDRFEPSLCASVCLRVLRVVSVAVCQRVYVWFVSPPYFETPSPFSTLPMSSFSHVMPA